jgi:FkbM family methyltransferase
MGDSKFSEITVVGNLKILVPTELQRVFNNFEPLSSKYVQQLLKPGETFVDVGANFGFYSALASSIVGKSGKVIAIEPSPSTVDILYKNTEKLDNVLVAAVAVSTSSGLIDFYHTDDYVNSGSVKNPPYIEPNRVTKISVKSAKLDNILQIDLGIESVDFLKIDVQGDDVDVLDSCGSVLSNSNDVKVLVEWAPTWMKNAGRDPMELPITLTKLGFRSIICIDDWLNRELTVMEFYNSYKDDQSGKRFCNILAQK